MNSLSRAEGQPLRKIGFLAHEPRWMISITQFSHSCRELAGNSLADAEMCLTSTRRICSVFGQRLRPSPRAPNTTLLSVTTHTIPALETGQT